MTNLADIFRDEIRARGPMPFARFMELALYHPEFGYYEQGRENVGHAGDFYTSVSCGPLFGQLLAFQFAQWFDAWRTAGHTGEFALLEAGAHDARLGADILNWLQQRRPDLLAHIVYILIEPSARRRAWQAETLKAFAHQVRWVDSPRALHTAPVTGIFYSNELLDAFPVQRFGWDAAGKTWFEWGVTIADDRFDWVRLPGIPANVPVSVPPELAAVLPDGYVLENSPAAQAWWTDLAGAFAQGRVLAVDYGLTDDELISPARVPGTLRAYAKHRQGSDALAAPGHQDLTAHVHFSAIQRAGETAGLVTDELITQPRFLTRIMAATQRDPGFGPWDMARVRQFQTLTHPEHLGRSFRVLIQSRTAPLPP